MKQSRSRGPRPLSATGNAASAPSTTAAASPRIAHTKPKSAATILMRPSSLPSFLPVRQGGPLAERLAGELDPMRAVNAASSSSAGGEASGRQGRSRHLFPRCALPPELLLQRLDHELHHRGIVRHAVQLEPAV